MPASAKDVVARIMAKGCFIAGIMFVACIAGSLSVAFPEDQAFKAICVLVSGGVSAVLLVCSYPACKLTLWHPKERILGFAVILLFANLIASRVMAGGIPEVRTLAEGRRYYAMNHNLSVEISYGMFLWLVTSLILFTSSLALHLLLENRLRQLRKHEGGSAFPKL